MIPYYLYLIYLQKDAEDALAEALPALEAARLALDDLDKNDVTEIRSFAKPPKPVQTICECIVVLKGIKEVSWKSAKGMMSEANFLKSLKELDVDGIGGKQVLTQTFYNGIQMKTKSAVKQILYLWNMEYEHRPNVRWSA